MPPAARRRKKLAPDLRAIAIDEVEAAGFAIDLPPEVLDEVEAMQDAAPGTLSHPLARDLRDLLWISIDDPESRDLDQVSVMEPLADGSIGVCVGIADVDAWVPRDSATDHLAADNSTTVYTGIETFHMLPSALATGQTSLLEGVDRAAIVIEFKVDSDGAISEPAVYRALVRNQLRLSYEDVARWLEDDTDALPDVDELPGCRDQIELHARAVAAIKSGYERAGVIEFDRPEVRPVFDEDEVVDLVLEQDTQAHRMIATLMVAVNSLAASFLRRRGQPRIARVQTPNEWEQIVELAQSCRQTLPPAPDAVALAAFMKGQRTANPAFFPELSSRVGRLIGGTATRVMAPDQDDPGHFGLAVDDYTRATAPNRRYLDLVTQRLIKAAIDGGDPPYSLDELEEIVDHAVERERAAERVERTMRRVYGGVLIEERVGRVFDAVVTGVTDRNAFARLLQPPVEGRVMRGASLHAGQHIRVRLVSVDVERGFIDFELPGR